MRGSIAEAALASCKTRGFSTSVAVIDGPDSSWWVMRDENVTQQTAEMLLLMCFCKRRKPLARDAHPFGRYAFGHAASCLDVLSHDVRAVRLLPDFVNRAHVWTIDSGDNPRRAKQAMSMAPDTRLDRKAMAITPPSARRTTRKIAPSPWAQPRRSRGRAAAVARRGPNEGLRSKCGMSLLRSAGVSTSGTGG